MIPFIVAGLTTGAVYGLAAVGLVLTYKTSGIFNFAHGALATVAAYVFYDLYVVHGVAWYVAGPVSIVLVGVVLGLVFERLGEAIEGTSLVMRVVVTVGVFLIVQASVTLIFGTQEVRSVPAFLPTGGHDLLGAVVTDDQIIIVVFSVVMTALLYAMFRLTRLGISMRAVVDNPELLGVAGTNPSRVRRYAWVIGVAFAAVSGILIAPRQSDLSGINLTFLVLQAFGAAAIGAFSSLPITFIGGLAIGVGSALCSKYFTTGLLSGLPVTLSFVVLFLVLLAFPKRRLAARTLVRPRTASTWSTPWQIQGVAGAALLVFFGLVPTFAGIHLTAWTQAVAGILSFLALGVLVRTSGQVSLSHVSFLAIGACGLSHLSVEHGVPWPLAVLLSGLIAVPIGAVLAIPAIRLSGLYLALATFGFGVLLAFMFYTQDYMFGSNGLALTEPRPKLSWLNLTSDKAYYYLVLVIVVVATLAVMAMTRSRPGRLLRGLADSPTAVATSGASVIVSQVLVFCVSAFLAAVAGALGAAASGTATGDGYPPLMSLTYLALVMITTGREPWYAVASALGLMVVPSYISAGGNVTNYLTLLFGVSAVLLVFTMDSNRKLEHRFAQWLDPIFRRRSAEPEHAAATPGTDEAVTRTAHDTTLQIENLQVRFGGLRAVEDVTLHAPTGRITGLIGPNGAGKTTTFNACSGLNRPSRGRLLLGGRNISRLAPSARARRGIGRTFQQMELFDSMTIAENVRLGVECSIAGANPLSQLIVRKSEMRRVKAAAADAMALCGIAHLADQGVASLSTGQRRLVELARCLAGPFDILLLDEPSSGLDKAETATFGRILTRVVNERRVGILLVEHDMSLVMSTCDYLYVLDFGRLIFEGTPAEAQAAEVVRAAYLGDTANTELVRAELAAEEVIT